MGRKASQRAKRESPSQQQQQEQQEQQEDKRRTSSKRKLGAVSFSSSASSNSSNSANSAKSAAPVASKNCWLLPASSSPSSPSSPSSTALGDRLGGPSPDSNTLLHISSSSSPLYFSPSSSSRSSPLLPPPPSPSSSLPSLLATLVLHKRNLWPSAVRHATLANSCLTQSTPQSSESLLIREPTTPSSSFHLARVITNPFDSLTTKKGVAPNFVNRAAAKLGNIDALLDFQLTSLAPSGGFKFVDLCGAPGGFSEYLLFRCHLSNRAVHGWGMSLAGENGQGKGCPWKLEGVAERLGEGEGEERYRCFYGRDGRGDVYERENVEGLERAVEEDSGAWGYAPGVPAGKVHLVVADGGFDKQRDAENQEALAARLVAAQAAAGIRLLNCGGTMVLKYFGSSEPATLRVLSLLSRHFRRVTVTKPVTSRPASAERYLVCDRFLEERSEEEEIGRTCEQMLRAGGREEEGMEVEEGTSEGEEGEEAAEEYREYFELVDCKVLELNNLTCGAIVSLLDRACGGGGPHDAVELETVKRNAEERFRLYGGRVDVKAYREAWKL